MINVLLQRVEENEKLTDEQKKDRKLELKACYRKNYKQLFKLEAKFSKKRDDFITYVQILGIYYELRRICEGAETVPFMPGDNFIEETEAFANRLRRDSFEMFCQNNNLN